MKSNELNLVEIDAVTEWDQKTLIKQMIHPNRVASTACEMIERWGMVAAVCDGEDSTGRQKMRNLTPKELVEFACETAKELYEQFETRGWLLISDDSKNE